MDYSKASFWFVLLFSITVVIVALVMLTKYNKAKKNILKKTEGLELRLRQLNIILPNNLTTAELNEINRILYDSSKTQEQRSSEIHAIIDAAKIRQANDPIGWSGVVVENYGAQPTEKYCDNEAMAQEVTLASKWMSDEMIDLYIDVRHYTESWPAPDIRMKDYYTFGHLPQDRFDFYYAKAKIIETAEKRKGVQYFHIVYDGRKLQKFMEKYGGKQELMKAFIELFPFFPDTQTPQIFCHLPKETVNKYAKKFEKNDPFQPANTETKIILTDTLPQGMLLDFFLAPECGRGNVKECDQGLRARARQPVRCGNPDDYTEEQKTCSAIDLYKIITTKRTELTNLAKACLTPTTQGKTEYCFKMNTLELAIPFVIEYGFDEFFWPDPVMNEFVSLDYLPSEQISLLENKYKLIVRDGRNYRMESANFKSLFTIHGLTVDEILKLLISTWAFYYPSANSAWSLKHIEASKIKTMLQQQKITQLSPGAYRLNPQKLESSELHAIFPYNACCSITNVNQCSSFITKLFRTKKQEDRIKADMQTKCENYSRENYHSPNENKPRFTPSTQSTQLTMKKSKLASSYIPHTSTVPNADCYPTIDWPFHNTPNPMTPVCEQTVWPFNNTPAPESFSATQPSTQQSRRLNQTQRKFPEEFRSKFPNASIFQNAGDFSSKHQGKFPQNFHQTEYADALKNRMRVSPAYMHNTTPLNASTPRPTATMLVPQ